MRHLTIILLFLASHNYAQEIKPRSQFLTDSIKIGQPVGFTLALSYPKNLDVVFPDSLYDFSPYELADKTFTTTKTDSTLSYDSAVYYLNSFEIDKVQKFKLPVFVLNGNDSTLIYANEDSVYLKELVEEVPDSVSAEAAPLIENTRFINVPLEFNYPYLIIALIIFVVVVILVIILFGKKIKKAIQVRRLRRNHNKFNEKFDSLTAHQSELNSELAEKILIYWKKYLESLEKRPYTKLTTKEIIAHYNPESIIDDLKSIDRIIYSNKERTNSNTHYESLKSFAQLQYANKIEEVKNG